MKAFFTVGVSVLAICSALRCPAADPDVSNVRALQQQQPGSKLVDIWYDLDDRDSNPQTVTIAVSTDGGANYNLPATHFDGHVGYPVVPGKNRHIVWNAGADWDGHYSDQVRFQITADDGTVAGTLQFSASSYSVGEGDGSVTITVTREGGSDGAASVHYATADDTAHAGSDYTSASDTLNWGDGVSAARTFNVTILNDDDPEAAETFTVQLSSVVGATLGSPHEATVTITDNDAAQDGNYLVIDLSGGSGAASYPVSYLTAVPAGGWSYEYRTTKLVLRKITHGADTIGSPSGELGRDSNETQHTVTLTKDFYIGVFEVTQEQWNRVMGNWPSYFNNTSYRASRPVEQVSYNDIRGSSAGAAWPGSGAVDAASFMGMLRSKTGLTTLDLPTESQWEYACRAGTDTALNSGQNLTSTGSDPAMDVVGRYLFNGGSGGLVNQGCAPSAGTALLGTYQANAWGLYDMHGNVWEWCLDWYGTYPGDVPDPKGAASGSSRVLRGGGWYGGAGSCRSAYRNNSFYPSDRYHYGFRVARTLQ